MNRVQPSVKCEDSEGMLLVRRIAIAVVLQAVKDANPNTKFGGCSKGDYRSAVEFLRSKAGRETIRGLGMSYERAMKGIEEYYDTTPSTS